MLIALTLIIICFTIALIQSWHTKKMRSQQLQLCEPISTRTDLIVSPRTNKIEIYEGDILDELARTELHIIFGVMSGAGKSTSMKTIIWKIHGYKPTAKFVIVDPKSTDWLGLQRYPKTVFYISGEPVEQLIELREITLKVFNILDDAIAKAQRKLERGDIPDKPEFDLYLIIDEWFALYDALKKLAPKEKSEFKLNDILMHVNGVIAKGREYGIHCFLVGQSHLSTETGISTALRRSTALVGQGRLTSGGDGGYASIEGIIKDANVFKNPATKNRLMKQLDQAIAVAGDSPIILTTMGNPRIGIIDDLSHIHSYKITDYQVLVTRS